MDRTVEFAGGDCCIFKNTMGKTDSLYITSFLSCTYI